MKTEKTTPQDPYQAACTLLGIKPLKPLKDRSNPDKVSVDAYERLITCIRAKNMQDGKVWQPIYDGSEWHYYPRWFKNKSGFGFSRTDCDNWYSDTIVGSRLEYRSYALMMEGVKEFNQLYQDYLN